MSPPKFKSSSSQQRTRGLGADPSSAKQGAREALKRKSFRVSHKRDLQLCIFGMCFLINSK